MSARSYVILEDDSLKLGEERFEDEGGSLGETTYLFIVSVSISILLSLFTSINTGFIRHELLKPSTPTNQVSAPDLTDLANIAEPLVCNSND